MQDIIRFSYCEAIDSVLFCGKKINESYQFYLKNLSSGKVKRLTNKANGQFLAFINDKGDKLYFFDDSAGNERGGWKESDISTGKVRNISSGVEPFCSYEFVLGAKSDNLAYCWYTRNETSGLMIYENLQREFVQVLEIYKANDVEISFPIVSETGRFCTFYVEKIDSKTVVLWDYQARKTREISTLSGKSSLELLLIVEERYLYMIVDNILVEINIKSFNKEEIYNFEHEVQYLTYFDGKIVFSAEISGKNQVLVLEVNSIELSVLKLEDLSNSYYQMFYRKAKQSMLFLGSNVNKPTDLYEVNLLGDINCIGLNSEAKTDFTTEEIFFSNPETKQTLQGWFFYKKQNKPVIINLHGGPHAYSGNSYSAITSNFLKDGFDMFQLNYSGSTSFGENFKQSIYGQPGQKECLDIYYACQFLIKEKGYSPDQIFLQGDSYGGFLALLFAGKFPGCCRKIVSVIGIGDLEDCYENFPDQLKALFDRLFLGNIKEKKLAYQKSNPINYLSRVKDEILIVNGLNDSRCPAGQMEKYIKKAAALEKNVKAVWFPGGHMDLLSSDENMKLYLKSVKDFLRS